MSITPHASVKDRIRMIATSQVIRDSVRAEFLI
jgi:hypothetical protein